MLQIEICFLYREKENLLSQMTLLFVYETIAILVFSSESWIFCAMCDTAAACSGFNESRRKRFSTRANTSARTFRTSSSSFEEDENAMLAFIFSNFKTLSIKATDFVSFPAFFFILASRKSMAKRHW